MNADSFHHSRPRKTRRQFAVELTSQAGLAAAASIGLGLPGCTDRSGSTEGKLVPDLVWGRLGLADGRFQKPRAMTIDAQDRLFIVDKTGRVQVFDTDGKFLRLWNTPAIEMGKPTGLGINRDGLVMVADTHYFRILFYTPEGTLLEDKTIGGKHGPKIGEFAFVTDVVQDRNGNYFISEYGEFDRIQKYSADGEFICRFGESGDQPLQFSRPQSLAVDSQNRLWITDACNHRIQVVRCEEDQAEVIQVIGQQGSERGELRYPYGMWLAGDDDVYVVEYGNHRIQRWNLEGRSLGVWGSVGKQPGQFQQPWALVQDSEGRTYILDTGNERVQRFNARSIG